ncbi:uroporphyrinogen decarboxylase family protein, partial [Listeria booriae]|uniref:uroporphyrinogen decarboxylase family protein n=2 Tax=Listeria TaxID=1637 RepID=UPI001DB644B8
INAGASAVQLFDSWVGALSRPDYATYIRPVIEKIILEIKAVHPTTPIIMQAVGAGHLLAEWETMPLDVVGVDWRETLTDARKKVPSKAIQGNLDPSTLLAPEKCLEETERILQEGVLKPGYIFNLGHGVFPEVSPEMLKKLTAYIHDRSEILLNKG